MSEQPSYDMHMDILFGALTKVDVPRLVEECPSDWWNQTLCEVNDCVVRLGIIRGEFHWHKHDEEDEFFFVLQGTLHIDVEDGEGVVLGVHEGYTVPRGIVHRTRAPEKVVMLMMEKGGVVPTGDQ
ncbi:MAG: cupin domain-containing protein [Planctomycetota bacterium]|nr:cupin domain-containing protein [Planctomycetota bacterium]